MFPGSKIKVTNGATGRASPVIDKAERYGWTIDGSQGAFVAIHKSQLRVDPKYQREVTSKVRIQNIARAWSWFACAMLVVSKRKDETLWVVDGQHRLASAMMRDEITDLPCLVFEFADVAEEASAYDALNNNRGPMAGYDRFKARLASGDKAAIEVNRIVSSANYKVSRNTTTRGVGFAKALMDRYELDPAVTEGAICLMAMIYDGEPMHERVFKGIICLERFLVRVNAGLSVFDSDNADKLIEAGPKRCIDAIDRACIELERGGDKSYAHGIRSIINNRRKASHRRIPNMHEEDQ